MRTRFVVAALVATFGVATALEAQAQTTGANPARSGEVGAAVDATPPAVPMGELALGTVRIRHNTTANGEALPAGTYTVRLTPVEGQPPAAGITEHYERWVEFSQGGAVKGKEVVSIVPNEEIAGVANDPMPRAGRSKVEMLRNNEYVRVWINRGGNHYLVYLVPQNQGKGN